MRRLLGGLLGAIAVVAALVGETSARAEPSAVRILDVTYTCSVPLRGGVYILDARAHSGVRRQGKWAKLAYAGLRAGNFGGSSGNMLAWVTAGKPDATTTIDNEFETFDVKTFGTLGVRREPCRRSTASVPLTSSGMTGGVAAQLGDEAECFTPRLVLVRFRAVLVAQGSLRRGPVFRTAHVAAREAKLAVRTPTGKRLVYADVTESGRARLFTARSCT